MKNRNYDHKSDKVRDPADIRSYFSLEKKTLAIVTFSGLLYNIGMAAGPWFEGQLAQCLADIISGVRKFRDMLILAIVYVLVILAVQAFRYAKRLYVRKFANNISRYMKQVLYSSLIRRSKTSLESEGAGALMTKAINDVDTCVEGIRKFTTEIFDTGVVMVVYLVMLFLYDWRLTLISMIFPPIAYFIARKLRRIVSSCAAACKESSGRLSSATLDRMNNVVTYRVYGQENNLNTLYEKDLTDYERSSIRSDIWETSLQPLYQIISMTSVIFILYFGSRNVTGTGWRMWNIAAFTTFLSCFSKLALKSSKAAKLFNAVQKARVSWKRIKPFMEKCPDDPDAEMSSASHPATLNVNALSFRYPVHGDKESSDHIFSDLSFEAHAGDIIGVTGPVASGKSSFGRIFLNEFPYDGSILINGRDLGSGRSSELVSYMGHDPELLSTTIEENILLGSSGDIMPYLKAVCIDEEVMLMDKGIHTVIGSGGVRLSGGQQARIALARTLMHRRPVIILDDPFSAVDMKTEHDIFINLRKVASDSIIILISHRLAVFPELEQIIWMSGGKTSVCGHASMMLGSPEYAHLYELQNGGADDE